MVGGPPRTIETGDGRTVAIPPAPSREPVEPQPGAYDEGHLRALDAVLFPENPVADAARIVGTLQAVMPAREGQFMGGIIGRFTWAVPTVMTIELGVVLEAPDPWRMLILGQIRALLA